jgi:cobalt-zinc-cadmium resistance protein CzcA
MKFIKYILGILTVGLLCCLAGSSSAQIQTISLDDAIVLALESHAGLQRDQFRIDQQYKLAEAGTTHDPMELYFSGEEFGPGNNSGIHSFNVYQNFNLPKAGRLQEAYYLKGASLAEKRMDLTDRDIRRQVSEAYYQLLFARGNYVLQDTIVILYDNFLSVATAQLETGETGKLPQLAARSHRGQAELSRQMAYEDYQAAFVIFNSWLPGEEDFDAEGQLAAPEGITSALAASDNPHLQLILAETELATAKMATEKTQLLPQINSGVKWQTASGTFPLFGYQLGLNIPLIRKSYNKRIQAAEIEIDVLEAQFETEEQALERKVDELLSRFTNQQSMLKYIQDELLPIAREQARTNLIAYQEGAVNYLEYLDGLEQAVQVKLQYLASLFKLQLVQVELTYWLGN